MRVRACSEGLKENRLCKMCARLALICANPELCYELASIIGVAVHRTTTNEATLSSVSTHARCIRMQITNARASVTCAGAEGLPAVGAVGIPAQLAILSRLDLSFAS